MISYLCYNSSNSNKILIKFKHALRWAKVCVPHISHSDCIFNVKITLKFVVFSFSPHCWSRIKSFEFKRCILFSRNNANAQRRWSFWKLHCRMLSIILQSYYRTLELLLHCITATNIISGIFRFVFFFFFFFILSFVCWTKTGTMITSAFLM